MSEFKVTHGIGEDNARPIMYLYEGAVEHNGIEYRFWFQYDERDGEKLLEFLSYEPGEGFDREAFEDYCYSQVEKLWNEEA